MLVTTSPRRGVVDRALFDHVVLATGHQWPAQQEVRPGYYVTPWPIEALAQTSPVAVGIRGSSLTAVDVAVVLANQHGAFVEDQDGLTYRPNPGTEGFKLTMMSRKGLLPEADFYFPVPHAPLSICTEAAVEALIARGSEGLLDQAFELFWRELGETDPAYVGTLAFAATPEAFGEAYFAERTEGDPFDRAASNLIEARHNHEQAITVPWRDAILRMHEVVAAIVPHLTDRDFDRFNRHLKPVFVDNYASVPHVSIERMLALHAAGKLGLLALGDDYRLDTHRPEGGVVLDLHGQRRHLPVFIEATGQRPLSAIQFPFLSLIEQGVVRDAPANDPTSSPRGLQIDDRFRVVAEGLPRDRLFCLSLPFIMGRHPFVQGITSSHAMGLVVGQALAEAVGRPPSVEIASIAEAA